MRVISLVQTSSRSDAAVGSYELPKSRDSAWDNFGTISGLQPGSPGSPGKKRHSGVGATESRRVYYREYGGGILPRSGPWCVSWSKVPVVCLNTQGCPEMWTNHVGGLFWCRFKLDLLVPRPSLIPGLSTRPSTPFQSWKLGACLWVSTFRNLTLWNPKVGFTPWLGSASRKKWQASLTHTDLHKTNTKWLMHSWNTFGARTSYGQLGHTRLTMART
jgi:hypothetical protein